MIAMIKRLWGGVSEHGDTLTQKTARGMVWLSISNICLNLTDVIQMFILVRLLTPIDFGIVRICTIAASYARVLTNTGISKALIQSREMDRSLINTAWVIELFRNLLQAAVLVILAPWIAMYFEKDIVTQKAITLMLRVFSLRYVLSAFRNPATMLLIRDMKFKRHETFERTYNILGFVVTVAIAFWLRSYWALVIGQIFLAAADLIGSYMMYPYLPAFRFNRQHARQLIKFGKHLYIAGILGNTFVTLDSILLGGLLGVRELGIYSVAKGLARKPAQFLTQVTEGVLFPALSSIQDNLPHLRRTYLRVVGLMALIRMPVFAGLAVVGPILLPLYYGAKHPEYLAGIPVFILASIAMIFLLPANSLLQAVGKPHLTWIRPLVACMFCFPMLIILGKKFGMIGIATVGPLNAVLFCFVGVSMTKKAIGVRLVDVGRTLLRPFIITLTMTGVLVPVVVLFARPTLLWLACIILLGASIYSLLTLAFHPQALADIRKLSGGLLGKGKSKTDVRPESQT